MDGSSFLFAQWLFLKLLALNYFFAFFSLAKQVKGLYCSKGIAPCQQLLALIEDTHQTKLYWQVPTLFWIKCNDKTLQFAAYFGLVISILALLGIFPSFFFFLLWIIYLSFFSVGTPFLNFQWDALLLEIGFIAIFFAIQSPAPLILILLLWFVLFRFMFSSGITKILYGSSEWSNLTAMDYHYETQPLPTKLAYYLHKLPKSLAKLSVLGVFFIEIIVPFFIFGPEQLRITAFIFLIFFQILIILTGNYAFFNTLTITMCVVLLNDSYLSWLPVVPSLTSFGNPLNLFLSAVGIILIILNVLQLVSFFAPIGKLGNAILNFQSPFCLVNSYGLFVHMTTVRYEIIVEGSEDGETWLPYEFKWKPGELNKPPRQIAPYQPRLDWQMWFAALSSARSNPWFVAFVIRLLEGSQDVLKLLKNNPFAQKPPKYIRALLYKYKFSNLKTKEQTGDWWIRELLGFYAHPIALDMVEK